LDSDKPTNQTQKKCPVPKTRDDRNGGNTAKEDVKNRKTKKHHDIDKWKKKGEERGRGKKKKVNKGHSTITPNFEKSEPQLSCPKLSCSPFKLLFVGLQL